MARQRLKIQAEKKCPFSLHSFSLKKKQLSLPHTHKIMPELDSSRQPEQKRHPKTIETKFWRTAAVDLLQNELSKQSNRMASFHGFRQVWQGTGLGLGVFVSVKDFCVNKIVKMGNWQRERERGKSSSEENWNQKMLNTSQSIKKRRKFPKSHLLRSDLYWPLSSLWYTGVSPIDRLGLLRRLFSLEIAIQFLVKRRAKHGRISPWQTKQIGSGDDSLERRRTTGTKKIAVKRRHVWSALLLAASLLD